MNAAILIPLAFFAQLADRDAATAEWRAHRAGLFVHWGVATGRDLPHSHSHARRSALNPQGTVAPEIYDGWYREFNPVEYNPDAMLKLAHEAGMRYAVFVAKHHDGFSMYRSDANPYNVMATPYGRDVAAMFAEACRRQGLALGWQISPKDWKHPDFNTDRQERYNAFYESVIAELATRYGPLTTMWFDGTEPIRNEQWSGTPDRIAAYLHRQQPKIMLSNHSGGPPDFVSFEALVGPFDRKQPWEMAEPINPSGWVFNKPMPTRPFRELLRNLVYTVARDGNYLLDVGPMQNGQLYGPDAERLRDFAAWMKVNAESIHGTRGGPYRDGDWGGATCRGRTVYLLVSDRVGTTLHLPALAAKVRRAKRLDGGPLRFQSGKDGYRLRMDDRKEGRPTFVAVKLELDREALGLPVVDGELNLAAKAQIRASSVREGWPVSHLFDNDGDTAWDVEREADGASLEIDLGARRTIKAVSFSQRSQRNSWHSHYRYEVQVRESSAEAWRTIYRAHTCLGGIPVLELDPVQARFVRLQIAKPYKGAPVELAELRVF